jgi:hypothetical protein
VGDSTIQHTLIVTLQIFSLITEAYFSQYFLAYSGKAVPLQAWIGPEGSKKLRFPGYKTKAQDGGKVVSLTHRPPLPPGNAPGTHFCQSAIGRIMSMKNANDTI